LAKKALSIWVFSSFTFVALLHLIDAISALIFGNPMQILRLYPFIGVRLQGVAPLTYFWASAGVAAFFWGVTCLLAFENPVETFLNKILSDAKTQGAVETQLLEKKGEVLDAMYETIESSDETLREVRDLVCNVRAEAMQIPPLKEYVERIKTDLSGLRREIRRIEERAQFPNICPACSKPLMPEFNLCPYCGEGVRPKAAPILSLKDYK
jgi:hypothetical protein